MEKWKQYHGGGEKKTKARNLWIWAFKPSDF